MTTTPPPPPPSAPQGQPYGPPQGQPYGITWQDPQPGQQAWGPGHPPAPPVPPQPEQRQRSWFRRHKIMTALLVLVGIGVVGSALGGGEEPGDPGTAAVAPATPTAQADPSAEVEAEPAADEELAPETGAEPAADEEAAAEEEPAPETEAEPAADTPGLDDAVRDGGFEFVVTGVETGLTTIGEGFTEETPQGQFVLIQISVTNVGERPTTLFDSNQVLIDEQGRQHSTSSASIWLEDGLWLDEINPGNSVNGVLLYDIPVDAVPTTLELHDSMFSGGVTVSLQ